ncbi:MAG: ATP-binding cassette domain-containing protein [Lachnospiraceae bacterium]|nr:ATP-binding cassette domain-containing protein [Lachnospiraceae bacterium]
MRETVLKGRRLQKRYGKAEIIKEIDIDIYRGDFTVVMGTSGSGKSTLLHLLSGMDTVSGGEIGYVSGKSSGLERSITNATEKEMAKLRANDFGFVFQKAHLVSNLTLSENIQMAGYISDALSEKEVKIRADQYIQRMDLAAAKDRLPSEASGGEAQRAAVARAVMAEPEIVFADEPTGALNRANTKAVLELFAGIHAEGQTILMVTHDREAALYGNRILYLEDGRIRGELCLSLYQDKDSGRKKKLEQWLVEMRW